MLELLMKHLHQHSVYKKYLDNRMECLLNIRLVYLRRYV